MEERVSGIEVTGDWGEVVEHGERVTRALRDVLESGELPTDEDDGEVDEDALATALEQWDEWRPKSHELLGQEIREKTAEHASVGEGAGERAGQTAGDDLQTAGEEIAESYRKLESDDTEGAVEKWQDSLGHVARAADSASRKAIRSVEDTVYKRLMTQVAPYYFDNALVSANLRRSRSPEGPFTFEVNVNEDGLKAAVTERLEDFEDEIDRWHVDVEKDTEAAEAAEGVEAPEPPQGDVDGRTT
jgi:hypothetical protein